MASWLGGEMAGACDLVAVVVAVVGLGLCVCVCVWRSIERSVGVGAYERRDRRCRDEWACSSRPAANVHLSISGHVRGDTP